MKAKIPFDKNAMKQFFTENVEKIAFGVVVVCSLFLIYRAVDRETFKRTPTELTSSVSNLEAQIDRSPPEYKLDLVDYVQKAEQSRTVIKEDLYAYSTPWNPPLFEPPTLRSRPTLVPLAELRGAAGMGSFSMRSTTDARGVGRGDNVIKGKRWVVITGLVPIKEQIDAYKRAFAKVKDYKPEIDDKPMYVYYYVQRAEVGKGKPGAELEWKTVPRPRMQDWASSGQEPVDPRHITDVNSALVVPLGPLVPNNRGTELPRTNTGPRDQSWDKGGWGDEVGHPKIRMARYQQEMDPGANKQGEEEDVQEEPEFDGPDGPATNRGGYGRGYGRGYSSGGLHDGAAGYGMGYGLNTQPNVPGEDEFREPENLLFRFFDFTVQPGKKYVYRAKLMLTNPSSKADDKFLDEKLAELKKQATAAYKKLKKAGKEKEAKAAYRKWSFMLTDWCEPTEAIAVPYDTRLLAVSVTQPRRETSPPTAKLMVVKWLEEDGTEAYKEFPELMRGKVLNFPNCRFPDMSELKSREEEDTQAENDVYIRRARRAARGDEEEEEEDDRIIVNYMSETILLDMLGGDRLPGRDKSVTAPAMVVLLDPDGNLVVRDEIEDLEQYESRTMEGEEEQPEMFEGGGPGMPGHDPYSQYFEGFE